MSRVLKFKCYFIKPKKPLRMAEKNCILILTSDEACEFPAHQSFDPPMQVLRFDEIVWFL